MSTIEKPPFNAIVIEHRANGRHTQVLLSINGVDAKQLARQLSIIHPLWKYQVFVNGKGMESFRKGFITKQSAFGAE